MCVKINIPCCAPPVWFEPTCVEKAKTPIVRGVLSKIHYTSPNLSELRSMSSALRGTQTQQQSWHGMWTESESESLSRDTQNESTSLPTLGRGEGRGGGNEFWEGGGGN